MAINILIFCRVQVFAEGLRNLLQERDEINVSGIAASSEQLKKLLPLEPDVIVAESSGLGRVFEAVAAAPDSKVLLINESSEGGCFYFSDLKDLVNRGLVGIVPGDASIDLLRKAIMKVYCGELWIDHKTISRSLAAAEGDRRNVMLTRREKEILHYLCSGYSNKKIAQKLFISEQTVKSHCNRLFKKFGVPNRVKLVLSASRQGSPLLH